MAVCLDEPDLHARPAPPRDRVQIRTNCINATCPDTPVPGAAGESVSVRYGVRLLTERRRHGSAPCPATYQVAISSTDNGCAAAANKAGAVALTLPGGGATAASPNSP